MLALAFADSKCAKAVVLAPTIQRHATAHPYLTFSLAIHTLAMYLPGALAAIFPYAATLSQTAVVSQRLEIRSPPHEVQYNVSQQSLVPFGAVITHCTVPGTIALTFDDGPFIYTAQLLDTLAAHGALATFFLNGVNKGSTDGFADVVVRAHAEGHQLGSHTYVAHTTTSLNDTI